MTRRRFARLLRQDRGQAAVETAIVAPMMVLALLGTLQLTLMHQASLMLEYAAFNAARSGAVWNMDRDRMRRAAIISLLPTIQRTDSLDSVLVAAGKAFALNAVLEKFGLPRMIDVQVLSPRLRDFGGMAEIEFDDPAKRLQTQMTVRVVYFYELKIPFANWVMWQSWYGTRAGVDMAGWRPGTPMMKRTNAGLASPDVSASCAYTGIDNGTMKTLAIAAAAGRYFMPLVTTYTIRMQSNPFVRSPKTGEQWAGPDDGGC